MALANVSLSDTFLTWMVRTNQSLIFVNLLDSGQMNSSGTLTITNASAVTNTSLNVANGMIKGDGGAISNVRSSALSQNSYTITSNSSSIIITPTNSGRLGSETFIDVTVSTSVADSSSTNIASAQLTNTIHGIAVAAFGQGNTSYTTAVAAFDRANSETTGVGAFTQANTNATNITALQTKSTSAFAQANTALANAQAQAIRVTAAYGQANTAYNTAVGAFGAANSSLQTTDLGVTVQGYDADTLKADTYDTLTVGFDTTSYNAGVKSTGTFTPHPANGQFQFAYNAGAHTLAPPVQNTSITIHYRNLTGAGTITTSGFGLVEGDALTTTVGNEFLFFITMINNRKYLTIRALQ